jgi:hypothetical protein
VLFLTSLTFLFLSFPTFPLSHSFPSLFPLLFSPIFSHFSLISLSFAGCLHRENSTGLLRGQSKRKRCDCYGLLQLQLSIFLHRHGRKSYLHERLCGLHSELLRVRKGREGREKRERRESKREGGLPSTPTFNLFLPLWASLPLT